MDAGSRAGLASEQTPRHNTFSGEDDHEALADRTNAAGGFAGAGAAGGARDRLRLRAQPAQTADRHVSRRSVGRRGQFQGPRLRLSRGNTTGPAYAAAAAQLLEFDANGKFVREIGKNLYAWSFAPHRARSTRRTTSGSPTRARTWSIKFDPEGRVLMVFGRKQEASDEDTGAAQASEAAAAGGGRPLPPGDRRDLGHGTATSSSATATSIRASPRSTRTATGSSPGATAASEPGQFNTPHSIAADAQGQCLCRRPRQPPHPGVRRRRQVPAPDHHRRAGADPMRKPAIGNKPDPRR